MPIEITFVHTVAVMKQHIKNRELMPIFTFLKKLFPFRNYVFFETSVLFYEQLTNNGRAIGTDEFVHDTLNSNYTILFFILLLDDYYFWYTNILIMYSNSFNC